MEPGWRWRATAALVGEPVAAGDTLVVRDVAHRVHALDLATGRQRWSWPATGPLGALAAVADDGVYVAGPGPAVTALDATGGAVRWQVEHDDDDGAVSAVTVAGELLVCRSNEGLRGLDRRTGTQHWWTALYSEAAADALHDGLLAVDLETGSLSTRVTLPAPPVAPLAVAGNRLSVLAADGCVHRVDAGDRTLGRGVAVGSAVTAETSQLTVGDRWTAVQLERELVLLPDA